MGKINAAKSFTPPDHFDPVPLTFDIHSAIMIISIKRGGKDMATNESIRKMERDKLYTKRYGLKLNMHTDAELIEKLSEQSSVQGYIRRLIREDIERGKAQAN